MDFNDYQSKVEVTLHDGEEERFILGVVALGLCGEAGEVAEKVKKHLRGDGPLDKDALALELGDVLWHVAMLAKLHDVPLSSVAKANLDKLESRARRGTVRGDGDYR